MPCQGNKVFKASKSQEPFSRFFLKGYLTFSKKVDLNPNSISKTKVMFAPTNIL